MIILKLCDFFISSLDATVGISLSRVIPTNSILQRYRLPAHITRVERSEGEQEEQTLGYADTKVVVNSCNTSCQRRIK